MTEIEKLEVLVQRAIENGWKTPKHGYKIWLPVGSTELLIILYEDYDIDVQYNYQAIIFNHDFVKALWGDKDIHDLSERISSTISQAYSLYNWQYHLQKVVISDDPIDYMYKEAIK